MNASVDLDKKDPDQVAKAFLVDKALIKSWVRQIQLGGVTFRTALSFVDRERLGAFTGGHRWRSAESQPSHEGDHNGRKRLHRNN